MGTLTVSALMHAEITAVLVGHPRAMSTTEIAQRIVGRGQTRPKTRGYLPGDIYPYLRQLETAGKVSRTRRLDGPVCVYWALTGRADSAWTAAAAVTGVVDLDSPTGAVIGGTRDQELDSSDTRDGEASLWAQLDARNRQIAALQSAVAEREQVIAVLREEIARRSGDGGGPQMVVQDLNR